MRFIIISKISIILVIFFYTVACSNNVNKTSAGILNSSVNNRSMTTNKPDVIKYESNTYSDDSFKFSVEYPKEWNFEIQKYITPSQFHNGSPNSGIKIFIGDNKKDYIYIHRSVSQIQIKGSTVSLTTWSGLKGNLSIQDISDQNIKDIAFRLEDTRNGFIGATGQVHNDNYNKYEEQIMNILKSIKLQTLTLEKVE